MSDNKIAEGANVRIGTMQLSEDDAHSRVAILFVVEPATEYSKIVLLAVSVKWLLTHGIPVCPKTGKQMEYNSTHIVQ